ncbi:hypothetical protein [Paenibacillus sp. J2TS4]|uniref:hypothetical protein n=1 Tax=Paenibacillus sp. J2TS4 TaxID=2807194 RepID=UPI001B2E72D6|nr:hypothetical protein [Paenibacillus sp. J2TS4]GIP33417.1 hypothetical protein J2TS4_26270 [Paenibacillus sp. J2TS4]
MDCYFSRCSSLFYDKKYLEFLLEHYTQLNLPYSFPAALSFLASPILMEAEAFLCFNEDYETIGALGYIYGTGENQYEDTQVVQIQIVFLLEEYRRTRLFLQGLQYLTQYIAQLDREVREIRFWAPADNDLRKLCTKVAERKTTAESVFGEIDEYRASFQAWHSYAAKFRHETYF